MDLGTKRKMVQSDTEQRLSTRRKCKLIGLERSSFYYEKKAKFDSDTLEILHQIDEIYTQYSFYGHRRVRDELDELGFKIGKDRGNCSKSHGNQNVFFATVYVYLNFSSLRSPSAI